MEKVRTVRLIAALGLIAVLASGAAKDVPDEVTSPTPAVVTLKPATSGPAKLERTAAKKRPRGALDESDRGMILLLLLSSTPPTR